METLNTLTIKEAIELAPAIGATGPAAHVSDSYQFVSTREILENVHDYGWRITNVSSQGRSQYAQHRVTLVNEKDLVVNKDSQDGIPRIEMFNSHNKSKRLMFAIGYFRFVCSNGLIVASGPAETIKTKHRFSGDKLQGIMEQVSQISERFPKIVGKIDSFRQRELSESEQTDFATYALKGRFIYRPELPKRFQDIAKMSELLLKSRRPADEGSNVWNVYNRVQENLIRGIPDHTRPIRGYGDSVRVNQLLWKGAETALDYKEQGYRDFLRELLIKDGKKGKISS